MEGWITCAHCYTRFKAFLEHCPKCGKASPTRHAGFGSKRSGGGIGKGIVIGGALSAVGAVAVFLFFPSVFVGQFSQVLEVQDQENTQINDAIDTQPIASGEDDAAPPMPVVEVDRTPPAANPMPSFMPSTKPDIDRHELALQVHELVNEERHAAGLLKLDYDSEIALIAEAHSKDMASRNYFEHVNPDWQDPSDRAAATGYDCMKDYGTYYTVGIAENLLQGWTCDCSTFIQ